MENLSRADIKDMITKQQEKIETLELKTVTDASNAAEYFNRRRQVAVRRVHRRTW